MAGGALDWPLIIAQILVPLLGYGGTILLFSYRLFSGFETIKAEMAGVKAQSALDMDRIEKRRTEDIASRDMHLSRIDEELAKQTSILVAMARYDEKFNTLDRRVTEIDLRLRAQLADGARPKLIE